MHGPTMAGFPVVRIGGVPLACVDSREAAGFLYDAARSSMAQPLDVHLVNAYTIALAGNDVTYRGLLQSSSLNLADGKPVTWAARVIRRRALAQVRGPSLMRAVCLGVGQSDAPLRHYFLGSTEATVAALIAKLTVANPDLCVAGWQSPPFRPLTCSELQQQDQMIRDCGADIVWVGLGTPAQDHETARVAAATGVTAVAVGAAFDFLAGTKREAPAVLSSLGLEWLFRLITEPKRLWRRYLIGNLLFVYRCFRPPGEDEGGRQ